MGKESRVDSDHVRVTRDDDRQSILYRIDSFGNRIAEEIADHHKDGTTDAYKVDWSISGAIRGLITGDFRGEKKNK